MYISKWDQVLKWPTFRWQCESLGVKVYKGCILLIHLFQFVLKVLNSGIQGCTFDVIFGYFLFYFFLPFGQKSKQKVKVMSKGARDVLLHSCSLFIYFSSSFLFKLLFAQLLFQSRSAASHVYPCCGSCTCLVIIALLWLVVPWFFCCFPVFL